MKASGDSGQLLELAFQSLPDAVFIIDAEMVEIIDCNPAAEKMFGYSREEMLGRPLVLFHVDEAALETFKAHLHPAVKEEGFLHLPEFKMRRKLVTFMNPVAESLTGWDEAAAKGHSLDDVFKTSKEQAEELAEEAMVKTAQGDVTAGSASYTVLWAKDGTKRPIVDSWAPIEDAMGRVIGTVIVFQDMTERKRVEDTLRRSQQLKTEFIQNVSHELRTPLAIARGYAELLEDGTLGTLLPEQQKPMNVIVRRLRMLSELVNDITAILEAETRDLQRETVFFSDLVLKAVDHFQVLAEQQGLILTTQVAADLPPVLGDAVGLYRVLDNLLSNALKFTPVGGCVTVCLKRCGENLVLEVADTGVGISPDRQEFIFERFYQVDGSSRRRYGGIGLGLALVKEIVGKHGGEVGVESEVGRGSVFTVILPTHDEL